MLYTETLMITFRKDIIIKMQTFTHSDESLFKMTSIVQDNKVTKTEFHQYLLNKLSANVAEHYREQLQQLRID